jgi:hypothetical protein
MKRHVYLLVVFLIWTQVDDFLAPPIALSSALLVDDDEYLPLAKRQHKEECSRDLKSVPIGLRPKTSGLARIRKGASSAWSLITHFSPPPLYIFMSLQI